MYDDRHDVISCKSPAAVYFCLFPFSELLIYAHNGLPLIFRTHSLSLSRSLVYATSEILVTTMLEMRATTKCTVQ